LLEETLWNENCWHVIQGKSWDWVYKAQSFQKFQFNDISDR